ncbi:Alkylated DNA repair dioxygenase AlkB [Muriicola jejuensis]|uniref:Alpha-ketoglutarate-dependent dioxygenase AlkB n=2 Tax=Muriicola jejuensis TaxID=504488 RepID=A0A6P0U9C3_9FLAO|nr:alpha-ketoglutarate-dependent dioxygenase AlkB [Muriicola jejuensis]SMP10669.1 Alkylated DNA repair dioxygenase AlkB [Muriicola jejuensis]
MQTEALKIELPESDIQYFSGFFSPGEAARLFETLRREIPWQQDDIRVFGKTYPQPRLTALFANNGKPYAYSNITMIPHLFTGELLEIKQKIERLLPETSFTTCLLNLYRDGRDSNGWHADDESVLGRNPVIASVTLGEERPFHFKHKKDPSLKHKMILENGSLLIMKGETQHCWLHQVPKTKRPIGERINLTFRVIR